MNSRHAPPDATVCAAKVSAGLILAPAEPAAVTSHSGHDDHDHDACSVTDD